MSANNTFPHEDVHELARDKSEESYKEWDNYIASMQPGNPEGMLTVTHGLPIHWDSHNGDGDTTNNTSSKKHRRWIFALRHGERVDLTFGHWVQHCFDAQSNYVRKDLNMPLKLGERVGGKESYHKDSPLTRVGRFQASLVGEGLRLAGISVKHVYSSAALRCVETAHAFLEGLQADPSVKVKVEPGLLEFKQWHLGKGLVHFMTPQELHKAGYNVDLNYKPYVTLDVNTTETLQEFYKRSEFVIHSAVKDTEAEGGNIIFVGHACTLDITVVALKNITIPEEEREPYQISKDLLRVPYCAFGAMKDNPMEVVPPPCPPSINTSSARYDWRQLLDIGSVASLDEAQYKVLFGGS